jgi:TRAP-type C4-dicarboxylate transport system substrate-binding protein
MRRTIGLTLAAAVAVAGLGFAAVTGGAEAQTVEGPKVAWKFSSWGQRRAVTEGMEYIVEEVAKRTNGNFTIKMFYGEALSQAKENLDGISLGAFESGYFCAQFHPGKNKPINVLDLPFLPLTDLDVTYKVHQAVFEHPDVVKTMDNWNAFLYMTNALPQFELMGRGEVPKGVEDFKGVRVSLPGQIGRALELLGFVRASITAPEAYTALERGTIDAVAFPYTYTFSAYKVDQISKWVTTNMKMGTTVCPTMFSRKHWEALPAQYKQLLLDLRWGAHEAMRDAYVKVDKENEAKWAKDGLKMIQMPEDQVAEFRRIGAKPVWDAWVKENQGEFDAQGLLDLVFATAGAKM